ncbi:MAG: hypothetical protein IMX04_02995 [Candidatus Carbobacillus altaicus]|nr:hypothetical protein [Candidatus Carbobacillus altaicus]
MNVFAALFRMEWRLFRRDLFLWLAQIFLLLYYTGAGWYYYRYPDGTFDAGGMFKLMSYWLSMGVVMIGLLAGVLSARREHVAHFDEIMSSLPGDALRPFAKLLAWATVVLIFFLSASVATLGLQWLENSPLLRYWSDTVSYLAVFWVLPQLSAGILGYVLGMLVTSNWIYPLILLVWLTLTPYNGWLEWFRLPHALTLWLNQGEIVYPVYISYEGLAVNAVDFWRHIFLLLLSLSLLAVSLLIRRLRDRTWKERIGLITYAMLFFVGMLALVVKVNPYPEGENVALLGGVDMRYYETMQQRSPLGSSYARLPSFSVQQVVLDVEHQGYRMTYTAELGIQTRGDVDWLEFTLYHGYTVQEAKIGEQSLPWEQEGDLLRIKWPGEKKEGSIVLRVEGSPGSGGVLKPQAIYLPSGFPWYPVPGKWRVAESIYTQPAFGYQIPSLFLNLELEEPTYFNISVSSPLKIYSNLSETGANAFRGTASGPTLLAGKLVEARVNGFRIVAPPDQINRVPAVLAPLQESIKRAGGRLGTSTYPIPSNIFVTPLYSAQGGLNFPFRVYHDELHLDEGIFRIYYGREGDYLAQSRDILPAFYWYNRYRESDGYAPFFLAAVYEQIYDKTSLSSYVDQPMPTTYQKAVQEILLLEREGKRDEAKEKLSAWYKSLTKAATGGLEQ